MDIDIDFEVFKALTNRRRSEAMSYNEVLRELLKLPVQTRVDSGSTTRAGDWITNDVHFPEGTEFRARLKGKQLRAVVRDGALEFNGKSFSSLSMAAMSLTNYAVNGWRFWECLLPGTATWRVADSLRKATA